MNTTELANSLSAVDLESLRDGLIRKLRRETQETAVPMGSAFAAELKVLGLKEDAALVEQIVSKVLRLRP